MEDLRCSKTSTADTTEVGTRAMVPVAWKTWEAVMDAGPEPVTPTTTTLTTASTWAAVDTMEALS